MENNCPDWAMAVITILSVLSALLIFNCILNYTSSQRDKEREIDRRLSKVEIDLDLIKKYGK